MEDQSVAAAAAAAESEEIISDSFTCCVCLDLLYKPIVLDCGHISCFWCVHKSMSSRSESHCPICRNPYGHFPNICWMLHFLLLKTYPLAYKIREKQILEEEKKIDIFSPQFDGLGCESHVEGEFYQLEGPTHSSTIDFESNSCVDKGSASDGISINVRQLESHNDAAIVRKETSYRNSNGTKSLACEEKEEVLVADLLCAACKQLLYCPVVLNCGHVYCEACIINPAVEMLKCQACQSPHPRGTPKVCLELDHFLKEKFPNEYELRRGAVQQKQVLLKNESTTTCSPEASNQDIFSSSMPSGDLPFTNIHSGAGCDSCGMCPIVGDRFRCIDCVERIGFDLCGDCHKSRPKLPGRFNQQHTPEHRFELVKPDIFSPRNVRIRLVTRGGQDDLVIPEADLVGLEDGVWIFTSNGDSEGNTSSDVAASVTQLDDDTEDQNDTQATN
ncbi:hypothetical protein SLE2022_248520 [Rubroshorea leprosula]